jgi:hypothetical protein
MDTDIRSSEKNVTNPTSSDRNKNADQGIFEYMYVNIYIYIHVYVSMYI